MNGPAAENERSEALDALRGVALLGVVVVNSVTTFRVSTFEGFSPSASRSAADKLVGTVLGAAVETEALVLFSFLFGLGLAAQYDRLRELPERPPSRAAFFARRLAVLFAIGLAHMFLLWNGDVLTLYALLGAVLAIFLGLETRTLAALGLVMIAVPLLPIRWPAPFDSPVDLQMHVTATRHVYSAGSFMQILRFRALEIPHVVILTSWSVPRTLALFFLGAAALRAGVLRGERPGLVRAIAIAGIALGAAAAWSVRAGALPGRLAVHASVFGPVVLGLGYGAAFLLLARRSPSARVSPLAAAFVPVGRMTLTAYLTQSLVLGAVFYGWGLGYFGRLGEASAALVAVALFLVQMLVSALWLRSFRFGPVEWVWRSMTYGKAQPLRRR